MSKLSKVLAEGQLDKLKHHKIMLFKFIFIFRE